MGHPVSSETKSKMSKAKRGMPSPKRRKPVFCLETKTAYGSALEAEKAIGVQRSNITQCCKGNRNIAGNFHWMYFNNDLHKAQ